MTSPSALAPAVSGDRAIADARNARILGWVLAVVVAVAVGTAAGRVQANPVLGAIAVGLVLVAFQRVLLAWPVLLGYVLAVILFVPIRRYTLAGGLPVQVEPYRILIALVLSAWLLSVLVDPGTRWRRIRAEGPVLGFLAVVAVSMAVNLGTVTALSGTVVKQLSFLASFFLVMYFVSSVVTTRRQLDRLIALLVAGGTALALASIVEWRTGYNLFNHLETVFPVFHLDPSSLEGPEDRGFRTRAFASAQHPIALAATLVLLLPLAVYLYRRHRQPLWMAAAAALVLGALATGSRTAVLMLAAELVVFFWMKRAETIRLLPLLLPLLVACQFLMPGTLGTFRAALFPQGGVIAEQQGGGDTGSGRIADLGPGLEEFARSPFFGSGFGTRLTSESDPLVNARILDNEWLGLLIEVGALGVLCLLWLYVRTVRRLAARARDDDSPYGWLLAGLGASVAGFAVSMFTFDAFSFIQVTFLSFVLLAFAAVALRLGPGEDPNAPGPELPHGPVTTAITRRVQAAVDWVAPSVSSPTAGATHAGELKAIRRAVRSPAPAPVPARLLPPRRLAPLAAAQTPAVPPAAPAPRPTRSRRFGPVTALAAAGAAHLLIRTLRR